MEILTGPAGSGKTSALLREYGEAIAAARLQRRPGRTLWIGPTHRVCEQVRRQLWEQAPVLLAPQVLTFDGFAERILQFAPEATQRIPHVMQRVLMRNLIDEFRQAGKLKYFGGIAHTSGFLDVVLGFIAELKREEAWPEHFQIACQKKGASHADLELGSLYDAYQQHLLHHQRYDAEGRFWSARDRLAKGHWEPFSDFDLVVVDGFSDFTHTQYEILGLMAGRSKRMVVSLPWEQTSVRAELFAKPQVAIERLKKVAACAEINQLDGNRQPTAPSGIKNLSSQLFCNPREVVRRKDAEGLEILAATGMLGEVRAIAERVKRLLVAGVAARDIVVAFRPVSEYAALVREIFSAAGIPFQCDDAEPLCHQPVIKAVLAVIQLELEDWPFERLLGLLNSGWFRPAWNEWHTDWTARNVAKVLRDCRIPQGRSVILKAFDPATQAIAEDAQADGIDSQIGQRRAGQCLHYLGNALQSMRQSQDARSWANSLVQMARELGITPRMKDGVDAVAAWKSFEDLLFVFAGTEEMIGRATRKLDLSEMFAELSDLVRHQVMPTPARQVGAVEVLSADQVRGLDVPYLFLGGLSESSFPQSGGNSFLYSEADRQALNTHGLPLGHRTAQTQAEMLLFYSIVTRARKQLTLSYPAVSLDGQPLSPGPYLTSLRELFEPGSLRETRIEQLDPVPSVDNMLSLSDLRVVATSEALQKRPRWFQTLATSPVGKNATLGIVAAIDMTVERFQTRGFTSYEGIIAQAANQKVLKDRFSPQREFSATQLEGYAQCPFRFWVSDVLGIRELHAPDDFTDYGLRGDIVHDVLRQLHSELEPNEGEVPVNAAVEVFRRLMTERLSQRLVGSELLAALNRIEEQLLNEWGAEYAQQWSDYHTAANKNAGTFLKPTCFEVSFGTPHTSLVVAPSGGTSESPHPLASASPHPGSDTTTAQTSPAVRDDSVVEHQTAGGGHPTLILGAGDKETRIRGRIDRIDVGSLGGQAVFNIIDYKTGKKPLATASHLRSGKSLQLILYTLATQRLNLAGENAHPIQAGYWCLKETGWAPICKPPKMGPDGWEPHADWKALVEVLDELVPRLAAGIRSGMFPVFNSDTECMSYCPYRTTCRVSQIRPLEEPLAKHWEP